MSLKYPVPDGFFTSWDKTKIDVPWLASRLRGTYWGRWVTTPALLKAIDHSLCLSLYLKTDTVHDIQVGFARIVTDYATFSSLMDVFVETKYRGRGLGKSLIAAALSHEAVVGTINVLHTKDAQKLYEKFGYIYIEAMQRPPQ